MTHEFYVKSDEPLHDSSVMLKEVGSALSSSLSSDCLPRSTKASTYRRYQTSVSALAAENFNLLSDLDFPFSSPVTKSKSSLFSSFSSCDEHVAAISLALESRNMPTLCQDYVPHSKELAEAAAESPFNDPRHPTYIGDWIRSIPYVHNNIAQDDMDEPHLKRKHAILARHPEVSSLFGYEWSTKYIMFALLVLHLAMAYYVGHHTESLLLFFSLAWLVSGSVIGIFGVFIHECSHNLMAPSPLVNRLLGFVTNMAYVVPIAASFRRYHLNHHVFQGVPEHDADLPLEFEWRFIRGNKFLKFVWLLFFPFFYMLRGAAMCKSPQPWEITNFVWSLACDAVYIYFFGVRGFMYMFCGLWFGYGLHPFAAHFIQEHYTFIDGQETYSYYGILNIPMLNIGYHNEHHDFTRVSWRKIPIVRSIAPEFYNTIAYHTSWVRVLYDFIMKSDVGPQSRVGRDMDDHKRGRILISASRKENQKLD